MARKAQPRHPQQIVDRSALMQNARAALDANPAAAVERKRKRVAGRQEVSRDKCYPLDMFLKITGLSRQAYRKACETGLKTKQIGDATWVTGEAWFEWLMNR